MSSSRVSVRAGLVPAGREGRPLAPFLLLFAVLLPWALVGCGVETAGVRVAAAGGGMSDLSEGLFTEMENHSDVTGPFFSGEYATETPSNAADLIVVSYNLRYGEAVTETIDAFRTVDPLNAADIILLQEMDETGIATIGRELGLNYVYYPASVAEDGDNFGNAILSRWPISDPAKLILPGLHPMTGQQRTATRATVRIGDQDVLVYSTHIEVATASPALRANQFAAILDDIPTGATRVIAGGDFNTVTGRGVAALAKWFAASDLAHDSADLGPTYTRFGLRPSATDHIFSRGFERLDAGVLYDVAASDHFPVWTRYSLP